VVHHALIWVRSGQFKRQTTFSKFALVTVSSAVSLLLLCLLTAPLAPLFDPDEGYYPATAAESVASGSAWDPRLNGEPRWDKPILPYALIEAAFCLFGRRVAAARVPSALQGTALVLVVGCLVWRLAGPRAGALSAVIVSTTAGVQIFSRVAHPEIGVVLSVVTTELLLCLWLVGPVDTARLHLAVAAGVSMGYGVLAKGPVAIALPLLMLGLAAPFIHASALKSRSPLRDAGVAAVIAVLVAAPWYVAMTLRHGYPFLRTALWEHNVVRYTTTAYGHRRSVLFFIIPTVIALLPWIAFLPQAFRLVLRRDATPRQTLRTTMAASAVSAFAFYSFSSSKLPNYALVFIPPLAVLIALWLDEQFDAAPVARRAARISTTALLVVGTAVLIAGPLVVGYGLSAREVLGGVPSETADVIELLSPVTLPSGLLLAIASVVVMTNSSLRVRIGSLAAVGAIVPVLVLAGARPMLRAVYPWEAFGRVIASRPGPVWLVGYRAPSLTFYAGRRVQSVPNAESLGPALEHRVGAWLLLDRDTWSGTSGSEIVRSLSTRVCATGGRMVLVRVEPECCVQPPCGTKDGS
jgi:hypothetical protein